MRWRTWLVKLHRDVGYVVAGLTLIYAISGIAVNHRRHWDYDHARRVVATHVGPPSGLIGSEAITEENEPRVVRAVLDRVGRDDEPRLVLWRTPTRMAMVFRAGEDDMVEYDLATGVATHRTRARRPVYWLNRIHLNDHSAIWIWFADAFALGLAFLAVSGAIMLKGKNGIRHRGGWLMLIGLVVPVLVLLFG